MATNTSGQFALIFALCLPVIVGLGGFALDYSFWVSQRSNIRAAADAAALAAARQMMIGTTTTSQVQAIAAATVDANILAPKGLGGKHTTATEIIDNGTAIAVTITQDKASYFSRAIGLEIGTLSARSSARIVGGTKICVVTLSGTSSEALAFGTGAKLIGEDCGIYVNSENPSAVTVGGNAQVTASVLCAAGGIRGSTSLATLNTSVITDCPPMPDPLASRDNLLPNIPVCIAPPAPAPGLMFARDMNFQISQIIYSTGTHTLPAGRYCIDVVITGNAKVTLQSEKNYFFGNKLEVSGDAEFYGPNAALIFHSRDSFFEFRDNAKIDISAPTTGNTAGMLIWQPRVYRQGGTNLCVNPGSYGANLCSPNGYLRFKISANRANKLVGVIYLAQGSLYAAADRPIADQSPWTAIISSEFELRLGPTVVLNTKYSQTSVPVPAALANNRATAKVYLQN
ncbi:MAG: hypothetical protein JNM13_03130 [Hyphomicrobiaceae bacterium]|nr:hypothetical protein [Hyphomicrobiaceae bacterium]